MHMNVGTVAMRNTTSRRRRRIKGEKRSRIVGKLLGKKRSKKFASLSPQDWEKKNPFVARWGTEKSTVQNFKLS